MAPGPWPMSPIQPPIRLPTPPLSTQVDSAIENEDPDRPNTRRTPSYVGGLRPGATPTTSSSTPRRFMSSFYTRTGQLIHFDHDNPLSNAFIAQYNPVTRINRQADIRIPLRDLAPRWVSPPEVEALTVEPSPTQPTYTPASPDGPSPTQPTYTPASPDEPSPAYDTISTVSVLSEHSVDDELSYLPDREPPSVRRPGNEDDSGEDGEEVDEDLLCSGVPCPPWGKMLECDVNQQCVVCLTVGHHRVYCAKCMKVCMCCECHYNAYRSPYCRACPLCRNPGPAPPRPPSPEFMTRARALMTTLDNMRSDLRQTTRVITAATQTLNEDSDMETEDQVVPFSVREVNQEQESDTEVIIMNGLDRSEDEDDQMVPER